MKLLTKLSQVGATLAVVPVMALSTGHVLAASPGQIEGGNSNYTIANVTKGTGFANTQTADKCDTLQYRLHLYNPGPSALGDVKAEATINNMTPYTSFVSTASVFTPDGMTQQVNFQSTLNISTSETQSYVKGSTQLLNSNGDVIKSSADGSLADTVTQGAGGIDLGSMGESVSNYLEFKTQINCPTPTPPAYSCDELNLTAEDNKTVKLTVFNTTATNGATFKNAVVDWGDKSSQLTTSSVVGQTHTYSANGTYTISATAHFTVNGQDQTAGGPSCEKQVTFSPNTPPTVTPPSTPSTPAAPTSLVNTGAGNVAGLFAAVTAAGAVAYRWITSRRLSRQ